LGKQAIRYYNNHAAHTDSGLLTVVITTDVPGLELVDQKEKKWLAIERLVHTFVREANGTSLEGDLGHRRYAVVFWSDSLEYLVAGKRLPEGWNMPRACLHRVEKCDSGRYSVVFKQRTTPLKTACR
jgi:hypothetical protein